MVLTIALTAGCEHTAPFRPGEGGVGGPLSPGPFARITLSSGQDLIPAWLPDSNTFVYTAERLDRADRDRCLAFMPGSGGSISSYVCNTVASDDSVNVSDEAAPSQDGRIAYVRSSTTRHVARLGPDRQQLVVAPVGAADSVTVVAIVPFTSPWGQTYDAVSFLGWLSPTRFVMRGDSVRYPMPCRTCQRDTVRTGIEIFTLDFSTGLELALVPGTQGATSVAVGASGDSIYFTLAGDSRIHRFVFSSAHQDTAFDFGPGHIPRDIRFVNGVIAAIVDGRPGEGGYIHILDLAAGRDSILPFRVGLQELWFERPALSRDGRRVVAQGRSLTLTHLFDPITGLEIGVDTSASPLRDLWLFQLP